MADIKKIVTQRFPFTPEGIARGFSCAAGHAHSGGKLVMKVMFSMEGEEHHPGEL